MRVGVVGLLLVLGARAPIQCAHPAPPEHAHEDTPGDALWSLAQRFHADGDADAEARTLRFLIERYPSSRFAEQARLRLAATADSGAP